MKKIIFLLLMLTLLQGCYKDQSSTRWEPIGDISVSVVVRNSQTGDTTHIAFGDTNYSVVTLVDTLRIELSVTSSNPSEDMSTWEYLWMYYAGESTLDTIQVGTSKSIVWPITSNVGSYRIRLQITNPANGYAIFREAGMSIETAFSRGFYFLKETADGNTELDFHNPQGDKPARNLLSSQLGAPIVGSPTHLGLFSLRTTMHMLGHDRQYPFVDQNGVLRNGDALVVMGGRDLKVMLIEDMSLIYDHDQLFLEEGPAPDHKPLRAYFSNRVTTNFVFFFSTGVIRAMSTGHVGFPVGPSDGASFSSAVQLGATGDPTYVIFDESNGGRLLHYSPELGRITFNLASGAISPNNLNWRPLFMGTSTGATVPTEAGNDEFASLNAGWAIFQDRGNPLTRFLVRLSTRSDRPIAARTTIDPTLKFNTAQVYGTNRSGSTHFIYAGVGSELYLYNTRNNTETLITPSSMNCGGTITMITHKQGINNPNTDEPGPSTGYLIIATHIGGNYRVYLYELQGGVPEGLPVKIYEGVGKVVDMQFAGSAFPAGFGTPPYHPVL
jgi:hypothetical protein